MRDRERDRRVRRTRGAIVGSFNAMVLGRRPYEAIRVADIIEGAGVGRSTFYEHFRGKDAVLKHAFSGILGVLADAATEEGDERRIAHVLDHLRQNLRAARTRFSGSSGAQTADWLSELVEHRLAGAPDAAFIVPVRLAAAQAAGAQIAIIREWLRAPEECSAAALARSLVRASRGALVALRAPRQ